MLVGAGVTAVAVVVLVAARMRDRHTLAAIAKMTASSGFLVVGWSAGAANAGAYGAWILAGLVLGWFGDLFLLSRASNRLFLAGLVSFLLGHVAYIGAFIANGLGFGITGIALIVFAPTGALFFRWIGPSIRGPMRWGVGAYIAVITAMIALGIGTFGYGAYRWAVPGTALFYASDIGVALDRFKPARLPSYIWSLPLYYAGQICLAWSVQVAI